MKLNFLHISLVGPMLLWLSGAYSQPLPDFREALSVESQTIEIAVPVQNELKGGHLQGVQVYNGTLIVSGSSNTFGYLAFSQLVGEEFKFLGIKKLAKGPFNHAGGFQIAENWLAVGVEDPLGKRQSIIQLIDLSSFKNISAPPVYTLQRKGEWKYSTAGAVGLLKRKNHFLLAVGSWDCTTIDFYQSNHLSPKSEDFQFDKWTTWDSREAIRKSWTTKNFGDYQSLQLTEDATGIYISGFYKTRNGLDKVDVFQINVGSDPYNMMQKVATYSVQSSGDVTFRNGGGFAQFLEVPSVIAIGHHLYPKLRVQVFPIKAD
jgi:hypothetical protein